MVKCSNCGSEYEGNFCPNCGTSENSYQENYDSATTNNNMQGQPNNVIYGQPNNVMYAQPNNVMYAQPNNVIYGQPNNVMYAQPAAVTSVGGWIGWLILVFGVPLIGIILVIFCAKDQNVKNFAIAYFALAAIVWLLYIFLGVSLINALFG